MFLLVLVPAFFFHLITFLHYSEVHGSRMMNLLQLPIGINAAVPRSPFRRVSSDSSLYVGHFRALRSYDDVSGSVRNYSFSHPSTPRVLFDGEWSDESRNSASSSLPFPVDSSDEEYWSSTVKSSSSCSTCQSPESSKDPAQVKDGGIGDLPTGTEEVRKLNRKVLSDGLAKSLRNAGQPNLGDLGFSSSELIHIRHDWPCVLAPSMKTANPLATYYSKLIVEPDSVVIPDCKTHAIINGEGSSTCFQPLTFCSVHKNAGYLRLEDIEKSEYYTRVEVNLPSISRVTHRFNGCVLQFPPSDAPILFKNSNEVAVDGDDEDVSTPVPDLPEVDEPASPRSLHNRFCSNCGRSLSGVDLYLYRHRAFCSDDCRFFNILETALQKSIETAYLEEEEKKALETQEGCSSSSSPPPPPGRKDKGKGILYIG